MMNAPILSDSNMEEIFDSSTYIRGFCMLSLKLIQSPDIDFQSLKELLAGKNTGLHYFVEIYFFSQMFNFLLLFRIQDITNFS